MSIPPIAMIIEPRPPIRAHPILLLDDLGAQIDLALILPNIQP